MQSRIISIGNELLIGDTVNTNASWMGRQLTDFGINVARISTIRDDLATIKKELSEGLATEDLVITTGGLGPTHDDITKQAVAELLDSELVVHKPTLEFIKEIFEKRNIPFSESNYRQAEIPKCCEILFNNQGTAPGMWFEQEGKLLAILPGVPYEMKHLMMEKVLPKLEEKIEQREIRKSHYLLTSGIGESTLSDKVIGDLEPYLQSDLEVAYLPSPEGTRIRVSAKASTEEEWQQKVDPLLHHIKEKAGSLIVGEQKDLKLADAVGQELVRQDATIASAESCTGGAMMNALTDIPGSSRYIEGGIIAYENRVKVEQLGVAERDLKEVGAVSKAVALQMAKGVAKKLGTDIGISNTGIAGPGGGSAEKPVGLVWVGFWNKDQHFALKAQFTNDRLINKQRTTALALEMVRRVLRDMQEMPYGLQKQTA